jgi:rubrerythrin
LKYFLGSLVVDKKWTLKQQQALDAYAEAEREAFAACQSSPKPWDSNSLGVQAYIEAERKAWETYNRILDESEGTKQ